MNPGFPCLMASLLSRDAGMNPGFPGMNPEFPCFMASLLSRDEGMNQGSLVSWPLCSVGMRE